MTTTPKAQAIRRARHQLRVIQARRRAGATPPTCPHAPRALGFGVCDSIYRTTTSTGRPMPSRDAGGLFAWFGARVVMALIVALIVAALQ